MFFPVVIYGCESWTIKKVERWRIDSFELWCWRRLLRVPWTAKEIQPVHPKGNQSRIFIGRTDVEAETPIFHPPDTKNWLIWKDPDAGKDWRREEKGMTEAEMVGWHHSLNGHEFEWTPGVGDGQGGLACCDSWGCKELDTTEQLNWLTDDGFSTEDTLGIWCLSSLTEWTQKLGGEISQGHNSLFLSRFKAISFTVPQTLLFFSFYLFIF